MSLYAHRSPYNDISVEDIGYLRVLKFGQTRQSSMFTDDPFETDFEYPAYFHIALAICPEATRALMIGLGGATVIKRMWRDYDDMRIDAVELDPAVVMVARRFFRLPEDERIRVIVGDGREYVEEPGERYDIVMVDAFDDDRVPPRLTTREFMTALRARLAPGGVAAYNFIGRLSGPDSEPFRRLYRTMREVWPHVWVFAVPEGVLTDGINLITLASDSALDADELRARVASRVGGKVRVPAFHLFEADLCTEPIETDDVEALTDAEC